VRTLYMIDTTFLCSGISFVVNSSLILLQISITWKRIFMT